MKRKREEKPKAASEFVYCFELLTPTLPSPAALPLAYPREVLAGKGRVLAEEMLDSSDLVADIASLKARFDTEGYLFVRNFLPARSILRARDEIVKVLAKENFLEEGSNPMEALCRDRDVSPGLLNRPDVASIDSVRNLLEHKNLFNLMESFYGEKAAVVKYKWLRAVCYQKFTGLHIDRVYMGSYSERMITAWIPIGATNPELGSLLIAPGSHKSKQFEKVRENYSLGQVGNDGVQSGWIDDDAAHFVEKWNLGKVRWVTADFNAGDVCFINLDVFHISTANQTSKYRISCDVRFQPKSNPLNPLFA